MLIMRAVQVVMSDTYRTLRCAIENPVHEEERLVLEHWTGIQTLLGERLGRLRDAGELTEVQYDFAMEWLCYYVENGPDESGVLLEAWLESIATKES